MGKALKQKNEHGFYSILLKCTCSKRRSIIDEEDCYRKASPETLRVVEELVEDAALDKRLLIDISEEDQGYGINGIQNEADTQEATIAEQPVHRPKKPKRPDSISYTIIAHPEQERNDEENSQTWKVLLSLSEQSLKLDQLLMAIQQSSMSTNTFQRKVKRFHRFVEKSMTMLNERIRDSRLISVTEDKETATGSVLQSKRSKKATEHDESFNNSASWAKMSESSRIFSEEQNRESQIMEKAANIQTESSLWEFSIKDRYGSSEQYDERFSERVRAASTNELITVITDQFDELKKYATEHPLRYGKASGDVCECVANMETDIRNLPKKIDRKALHTPSFLRSSYPSPVKRGNYRISEYIEMEEFHKDEANTM